jgi:transcription elongation factor GreA
LTYAIAQLKIEILKKYYLCRKKSRPDGIFSIYINDEVMSTVSYYTAEGLKKLRDELDQLKSIERPKASAAIAEARDKGDLSENAEYDAAKEAQGLLELKISKMEELVSNARLIDESQLDTSKALVLSTVKIKNQANGMEMKYTLVAESEADLKTGKISVTSPIGKGLLGKSVGETAEINVPNGTLKFDVLEISRDEH